jgi:hypothetical protein
MAILKNGFRIAGARCFVVSDQHDGAPYADSEEGRRVLNEGLEGYYILGPDNEKEYVVDPAQVYVDMGDNREGINLPLKSQPETILKYSRSIDGHVDAQRELTREHPICRTISVKGNHERTPELDVAFDQLAEELGPDRLEIQSHFKRIGDGLFMHGDQAINPRKYHVDYKFPQNYSNFDGRYDESYVELHRAEWLQAIHDLGNRYLPWSVGRIVHPPQKCAQKILDWCHDYDQRHPDQPSMLEGVNHIFSGHTHDPYTDFRYADSQIIDSATGKPKIFHFYNPGASIFTLGWKLTGGTDRINRHCFNAFSVILNTPRVDDPEARIVEVVSFKWPQFNWRQDPPSERPVFPEILTFEDATSLSLRAGSSNPADRVRLQTDAFQQRRSNSGKSKSREQAILK